MNPESKPNIPHYVGVTGVQSAADVSMAMEAGAKAGFGPNESHNMMLGALVSPATIRNAEPENTSTGFRHVAGMDELVETLGAAVSRGAVVMVHMELHKPLWGTPGDADQVITLLQALEPDGIKPAVQLNGVLSADEIRKISDTTGAPLVLQFRKELEEVEPAEVIRYISEIQDAISMVLVDPSMGSGEVFNPETGLAWYERFSNEFPGKFTYGFAGGLGGLSENERRQTQTIVAGLARALGTADFSLDIESKARSTTGSGPEDKLDAEKVLAYVNSVRRGFDEWAASFLQSD